MKTLPSFIPSKTRSKLTRLLVGLGLALLAFGTNPAAAQDYHWLYESNFAETAELRLVDVRIVSGSAIDAGTSRLRVTAAFTNLDSGIFSDLQAVLTNVPAGFEMPTNQTDRTIFAPDIVANGRVPATNDIEIIVLQPLTSATNALRINAPLFGYSIGAVEKPCLTTNTLTLDSSFSNSLIQMNYAGGVLWISNPPPQVSLVSTGWLVIPGEHYPTNFPPAPHPFAVAAITNNATLGTGLVMNTNALDWLNWLCSARLTVFPQGFGLQPEPRDSTLPGTYIPPGTNAPNTTSYVPVGGLPEEPGDPLPQQAPFGFGNDVELTPGVSASASLGLGQFVLAPEIKVRAFKVKKIKLTINAHPYATFQLRAAASVNFDRKEHNILQYTFLLPSIEVGPFVVQLEMPCRLYLGGEGNLSDHAELTLSQQSDFEGIFEVDGGVGSITTTFTPQPLDFTPPQLVSNTRADAKIFAGIEVGGSVAVTSAGIPIASLAGTAGLEPYARLQVRADETPWWSVYGGLDGNAVLTGNLVFWPVVEKTLPLFNGEKLLLSSAGNASGPNPGGPQANRITDLAKSSGTEQRWSKIWPGLAHFGLDYAHQSGAQMALKENGNLAIASSTDPNFWLAELDRHGNSLWQKQYTGSSLSLAGMSRVPDDGYVMIFGGMNVMRVDEFGNPRWLKRYDTASGVVDLQIQGFSDSEGPGLLVSGVMGTNAFAMRLDDDGRVVWANLYDPGAYARFLKGRATRDNGFLLAGTCNAPLLRGSDPQDAGALDKNSNGWVLKLHHDGSAQWATLCSAQTLYDVAETADGGAIAVGGNGVDYLTPFRLTGAHKFSPDGAVEWQTTYDDATELNGFEGRSVTVTEGGYLIGGTSSAGGSQDGWLQRIRENGDVLWRCSWAGDASQYDVIGQVIDGGDCFYTLGYTASEPSEFNQSTVWLSAVPHSGQLWFDNTTVITNRYTYPRVDDFSGERWPFGLWGNAWSSLSVAVTPTSVTSQDLTPVVTHDFWTAPKELAQSQFNPENQMPLLNSAATGSNFAVQWPVLGSEGFVPQTATNVTGPWSNAPGIVLRANDNWLLQLPRTNSQQFFRLKK